MKHSKQRLKQMELPNGYQWFGFIDGFHYFKRKAERERGGFYQIRCKPKDIEDGNIKDMAKYEVTL